MKRLSSSLLGFMLIFVSSVCSSQASMTYPIWDRLSEQSREDIVLFLWFNEASAKREGLTQWNSTEPFPSLGYGHMIWFPKGLKPGFQDSFPGFLKFYAENKFSPAIPRWLQDPETHANCPWKSRKEFYSRINSRETEELRDWLYETRWQQALFYVRRLEASLEPILKKLEQWKVRNGEELVNSLLEKEAGILLLVDYVNFKGEGLNSTEVRKGIPWGLSRALYWMSKQMNKNPSAPLAAFSYGASEALKERVKNAKLEGRNESIWLEGWLNRTKRYKDPERVIAPIRERAETMMARFVARGL